MNLTIKELQNSVSQRGGRWFIKDEEGKDILHLDKKKDGEFALYFDCYRVNGEEMKSKFVSPLAASTIEEALTKFFCAVTERSYIIQFQHATDGWHSKAFYKNTTRRQTRKADQPK